MRAYLWTHDFLSSLQKGVQSTHAISEMSIQKHPTYDDWAQNHKTLVFLKGGNCEVLLRRHRLLKPIVQRLNLPCAAFFENEASLNNAITSVGVVVPEHIYSRSANLHWADLVASATRDYGSNLDAVEYGEDYSDEDRLRLLIDGPLAV